MFSIVAAVAMTVVGQTPIYQYPTHPTVYHDIRFPDVVKTRVDVRARMPDGSSFPVPVINGYKPQISIKATASYVRRTFTYEHRKKWSGNTELVYVKSKPEPEPKPEPVLKIGRTNTKTKTKAFEICKATGKKSG